jgi:FKBP-type peptidyl-prolyl cis-trans isomerase (trigger factor)
MFAFMLADWAGDDSFEVEQLRAENELLQKKQLELRLTAAELRKTLNEDAEAQAENEKTMARLKEKLDALPKDCDCSIPADIVDELNAIR